MKQFLDQNFILESDTARKLYHDYANGMPIIDYHCHLSPQDIVEDRVFNTITEAWLEGDHYKWRAMRANGISEKYCTGDASDREKFMKWAETVPYTLRNPLYHWTHLELQRYFDINTRLDGNSADSIYRNANEQLADLSTQRILGQFKVEVVCTTDDPVDSLEYHQKWREKEKDLKLLPTFRADRAVFTENIEEWNNYIDLLSENAGIGINTYENLIHALGDRHDFFHSMGCRLSDSGLNQLFSEDYNREDVDKIFYQLRAGKVLPDYLADQYRTGVMIEISRMNHSKGWAQQFHLGALRNNRSRMLEELGRDTGFDSIGDHSQANEMSKFFDTLDSTDQLAKTIVYNLNPANNALFATMMANFNDGSVPGKMQFGSGWWFLDQKEGMENQLNTLSNMGLLSRFVGMITDSRSFLSFPRHEYFRRVLCNLIGGDVEKGLIPDDQGLLKKLIQDICYFNARDYFQFDLTRKM
jgi:glucuronate isomerase